MQSYKNYLQLENEEASFSRAYRETFLFQLINDVVKQVPDSAKGQDDYQKEYALPLEAKRRIRNEIFENVRLAVERDGVSAMDPDTYVKAFLETRVGQSYADYITENWLGETAPQRQKYDSAIKSWTIDQKGSQSDIRVSISPYDPLFSGSDIFDEHDQLFYWYQNDSDSDMIRNVHVGRDREIASDRNDTAHIAAGLTPMESDLTAAGYRIVEHYIKDAKTKRSVSKNLLDQYHALGDQPLPKKEAEYMERALQYLSDHGFDFDIKMDRDERLCAVISGTGIEVRLLDRMDPLYQGRIYDNGRAIYYGVSEDPTNIITKDNITPSDRMRLLTWYVGGEDVRMFVNPDTVNDNRSDMYPNNVKPKVPYIGQLTVVPIKDGWFSDAVTKKPFAGQQNAVSVTSARSNNNSVTTAIKTAAYVEADSWTVPDGRNKGKVLHKGTVILPDQLLDMFPGSCRYKNGSLDKRASLSGIYENIRKRVIRGIKVRDQALNAQISPSTVRYEENSPEVMFSNRLDIASVRSGDKDTYFLDPVKMQTMLGDKGIYAKSFRSRMSNNNPVVYGVFSDVDGNDYVPGDPSSKPKYKEYADDLVLVDTGEMKDGKPVQRLEFKTELVRKDGVPENSTNENDYFRRVAISDEHRNLYKALIVRDVLDDWVASAKDNFFEQVNLAGMFSAYKNDFDLDTNYTFDFSDDELVAAYQKKYWAVLTNTLPGDYIQYGDEMLRIADLSDERKMELMEMNLNNDMEDVLFGAVPFIDVEHPGKVYVPDQDDYEDSVHGFFPDNVVKYCRHEYSVSQQKNQSFMMHMLDMLQNLGYDDASCGWIAGNSYTSNTMRNNLIQFDDKEAGDGYPVTLSYSSIFDRVNYPEVCQDIDTALNINRAKKNQAAIHELEHLQSMNIPVRTDMLFHTLKTLGQSGCEPSTIKVSMDRNGIIKYESSVHSLKNLIVTKGSRRGEKVKTPDNGKVVSGYIGQVFEPDEYGAIHTQYVGNNSKVLIPGYNAFLTQKDSENPEPIRDRLRLVGWQQSMKQAITREIRRSAFTLDTEYNFNPHTASLNTVYRHMYDMTIDAEDYKRMVSEKDPEQLQTNINVIQTLAGRCRFPNEFSDFASTQAQSFLDHPDRREALNYDYYYSDLYDNHNVRVLDESLDGIFDFNMTGTARTAGTVRYLTTGTFVDTITGKVYPTMKTDSETGKQTVDYDAVCPLMNDPLFSNMYLDTWDRRQMASTQVLTALHTPRHVGAAMLNMDGWNLDDGFVVTREFAEANKIKDSVAYNEYADRHDGKQPPYALVDEDHVKDLFSVDLSTEEGRSKIYDEERGVLRYEFIDDPDDSKKALMCPDSKTGDYPFVYDPSLAESFEEQAVHAVQRGHDCYGLLRPLIAQDKLSDMHGNKGVISRVVDPAFMTSNMMDLGQVPSSIHDKGDYDDGMSYYAVVDADGNRIVERDSSRGKVFFSAVDENFVIEKADNGKKVSVFVDDDGNEKPVKKISSNAGDVFVLVDEKGKEKPIKSLFLNHRFIGDPSHPNYVMRNPYREDGNYPFEYDPSSDKTFKEQAVYSVQKAFGMHDMDNTLKVFADNPKLDVAMAPYSGMSRFNGGTVHELMSDPDDLVLDGKVIKGGMGYFNMVVVDMPADVKTHWYGPNEIAEGKGRKISGQLSWILQSKNCTKMSELFYGDNASAIDKVREYMIAIGMDLDENMKPRLQWHPLPSEHRPLIKLDSLDKYLPAGKTTILRTAKEFSNSNSKGSEDSKIAYIRTHGKETVGLAKEVIEKHRRDWSKQLYEHGGFMELPFQLDFKTDERAGRTRSAKKVDNIDDFLLQKTGQSYTTSDGKVHDTYGLPVLPPNLMASQELMDNTVRSHDYVDKYTTIHENALLYMACEERLIKENEKTPPADEKERKAWEELKSRLSDRMNDCKSSAQSTLDALVSDIVDKRFNTKHNLFRDNVMATRTTTSATAVWSADPRLDIDQVGMSREHAKLLGLMDKDGNLIPKGDCRVLIWRDPILHDGGVRYLRVVLDDSVRGITVNPLIDKSFDGDFDGDSAAAVPVLSGAKTTAKARSSEAHQEAFNAFSLESNLLEMGEVIEDEDDPVRKAYNDILTANGKNPDDYKDVYLHRLYFHDALDTKSNLDTVDPNISEEERARRQQIKDGFADLTARVNYYENLFRHDPASPEIAHMNSKGAMVYGIQALRAFRKDWVREASDWAHAALNGIATDHIVVRDKETVMQSMQHIAQNGSKGNVKKMRFYADNLGIDYQADEDGNFIPGTTKWITGIDADGNVTTADDIDIENAMSRHTALGDQRKVDKEIQETAAYKADNTSLGGMQAQKCVAAFRNFALCAATRLSYPVTQGILQSKHDPEDAKVKDTIARYWGVDVWDGYKLTGNFTGSPEEIAESNHSIVMEPVRDKNGNPIPKTVYNEETGVREEMMRENPHTGKLETVYEMAPVKCTREEWITQMKGMYKALKIAINPEFIDELADYMEYKEGESHQVYNIDGRAMREPGKDHDPIVSTRSEIAGLSTFTTEHGALLDRMSYLGKFKDMYAEALKSDNEKQSILQGAGKYAKDHAEWRMSYSKDADQTAYKKEEATIREEKMKSAYFLPHKASDFLAGYTIRRTIDEDGNTHFQAVSAPPIGSRKNMVVGVAMDSYEGICMGETDKEIYKRMETVSKAKEEAQRKAEEQRVERLSGQPSVSNEKVTVAELLNSVPEKEPVPADIPKGVSNRKMKEARQDASEGIAAYDSDTIYQK